MLTKKEYQHCTLATAFLHFYKECARILAAHACTTVHVSRHSIFIIFILSYLAKKVMKIT